MRCRRLAHKYAGIMRQLIASEAASNMVVLMVCNISPPSHLIDMHWRGKELRELYLEILQARIRIHSERFRVVRRNRNRSCATTGSGSRVWCRPEYFAARYGVHRWHHYPQSLRAVVRGDV